jgi:hypothetical protein
VKTCMDAASLEKREAWSAPARWKIAPGPVTGDGTSRSHARSAQHAINFLKTRTYTQQRHSRRSVTGLAWAGEVSPIPPGLGD